MIDSFGRKIEYMRVSVTDRCNFTLYVLYAGGDKEHTNARNTDL